MTRVLLLAVFTLLFSLTVEAKCTGILYTIEADLRTSAVSKEELNLDVVIPPDSWVVEKAKYDGTRVTVTVGFYPGVEYKWFKEDCSGRPQVIYVRLLDKHTILDTVTLLPARDFVESGEAKFITRRRVWLRNR
jgi:hypothetical protein